MNRPDTGSQRPPLGLTKGPAGVADGEQLLSAIVNSVADAVDEVSDDSRTAAGGIGDRWPSRVVTCWNGSSLLTRIRWLLLFATFNTLIVASLARLLTAAPSVLDIVVYVSSVGLWTIWMCRRDRERVPWWLVVVEVGVCTAVLAVAEPPTRAIDVLSTTLLLRSLYGATIKTTVRLSTLLLVYCASIWSDLPAGSVGHLAGLIDQSFPLIVPTVFGRLLYVAVTRIDQARRRERALVEAGAVLVTADEVAHIANVVRVAATTIVASRPDHRPAPTVELVIWPNRDRVDGSDSRVGELARSVHRYASVSHLPGLLDLPDTVAHVAVVPLRVATTAIGAIVVSGEQPVARSCDPGLGTLADSVALALERIRLTTQLRQSEQRHRALVQRSHDPVVVIDARGTLRSVSEAGGAWGLNAAYVGDTLTHLVHSDDRGVLADALSRVADAEHRGVTVSWRLWIPPRPVRHVEASLTDLTDDPFVEGIVLQLRDVTARNALEERLTWQASRDALTGLHNRASFIERAVQALGVAADRDEAIVLILLDLDRFKLVNDTLGHLAGDQVLAAVGRRLESVLRPDDMAARLGGDEFAVLLDRPTSHQNGLRVAQRIMNELATPVRLAEGERQVRASIGMAASRSTDTVEDLVGRADAAMYASKHAADGMVWAAPSSAISEVPALSPYSSSHSND